MDVYIGSNPKETHRILSKNILGLCLNVFNGVENVIDDMNDFKGKIFLDNGSFERFSLFLQGKISKDDYFNYEKSLEYFEKINDIYIDILEKYKNPRDLIITIPEIIGNSELSLKLQEKYLVFYKNLEKIYRCKIIVALQFNPTKNDWMREIINGLFWMLFNIPNSWIIGIPFGKDFNVISKVSKKALENFNMLMRAYKKIIGKCNKIHLFALGTINKIKRNVIPYKEYINSFDASSVNVWSRNSHYLSKISQKVLDIRSLKGLNVSKNKALEKQKEMFDDCNLELNEWIELPFIEKFNYNTFNFKQIVLKILPSAKN